MTEMTLKPQGDREIVVVRAFNAPRDLVFDAWTHPGHVVHWWGPNGFTNPGAYPARLQGGSR